jgi:uncharacterized protein (TIGR03086 family)
MTTQEMPVDLNTMQDACASTERIVAAVTADQLGRPTPCTEWDVRALLNHVIGTLALGEALLGDTQPENGIRPGGVPDVDLVGDDPLTPYRIGVERLLAAAGGDALTRMHQTPFGEMPGAVLGGFTTVDIAVHGWDLARATGQEATLDSDLAESLFGFAQQTLSDDQRAPRIGPQVPVAADAPVTDRLVGFFGRRP